MRKLILSMFVSLDGYISGPKGELDWFFVNRDLDDDADKFLDTVDTMLLGSATYKLFYDFWPTATVKDDIIADKLNGLHKIVFSKTLKDAPWGKWEPVKIISSNFLEEIKELKMQPGRDLVVWGGAKLAQYCIDLKLIDEYRLLVCPVILGSGKQLFNPADRQNLELADTKIFSSGIIRINYLYKD